MDFEAFFADWVRLTHVVSTNDLAVLLLTVRSALNACSTVLLSML